MRLESAPEMARLILPQGLIGKISLAISGADSSRIYALIENDKGGLYVSDDAGTSWKLVNEGRNIRQRAFYYTHVFADPNNKDTVYMLNTSAFRSTGGGNVTYDMSANPRHWSNQAFPTAQFYHVVTTKHVPYHVCGAQQDNSTLCVDSRTNMGRGGFGRGSLVAPYEAGGGEPGYIATDPRDPDLYYAGANNGSFLTRLNRRTGEIKEVGAYPRFFSGEPSSAVVERWQWTYPIIFSPVDPR